MAPHAEDAVPGTASAAHGKKLPQDGDHIKSKTIPDHMEFSYPPFVPQNAPYSLLKQYHSKPTKLRVACIGAGASGLCLAHKMEKMLTPQSWELTLFDKNPHFGGTWYENTYPGVACDVSPSHNSSRSLWEHGANMERSPPTSTPSAGTRIPTGHITSRTAKRSGATLRTLPRGMAPSNT